MNDLAENAVNLLKRIKVDGEPVIGLYDQWELTQILELAANVTCLTFTDGLSGRSAVWYVDGTNTYCGSHIEVVSRLTPHDILITVSPWLDHLARTSLAAHPVAMADTPFIPYFVASQLATAWCVRHFNAVELIQTSLVDQKPIVAELDALKLTSTQLHRILQTRIGIETLVLLSPFTDAPLRSQMSFVVEHQLIHRFYDPLHECAFYLAWWERKLDEPPSFYCPKLNFIVSDHGLAARLVGNILGWYLSHPEHHALIEHAVNFDAADFGLGHASTLLDEPIEETTPPKDLAQISSADLVSDSWAFLKQAPLKTLPPLRSSEKEKKDGRKGWLRKFRGS